jgi:hypothetical protein
MKRNVLLCLVVPVLLAGCNTIEAPRQPGFGEATQGLERSCSCLVIPPAPPITAPIDFDTYPWGNRLYPTAIRSAYTILFQHPTDSAMFVVHAFDVTAQRTLFWGIGTKSLSYRGFRWQKLNDLTWNESNPLGIDFSEGGAEQLPKGPSDPNPPGPGTHDRAWIAAYKEYKSHEELMDPPSTHP